MIGDGKEANTQNQGLADVQIIFLWDCAAFSEHAAPRKTFIKVRLLHFLTDVLVMNERNLQSDFSPFDYI